MRQECSMKDEKIHWMRYGIYFELLVFLYLVALYVVKILNIELGQYRDYVLESYSIITFPGIWVSQAVRSFTGLYIGLALGMAVNLLAYFAAGALVGFAIWMIRHRTEEDL